MRKQETDRKNKPMALMVPILLRTRGQNTQWVKMDTDFNDTTQNNENFQCKHLSWATKEQTIC